MSGRRPALPSGMTLAWRVAARAFALPQRKEWEKTMNIDRARLVIGMQVDSADGHPIGTLKQVCDADLLVDRRLRRDIYVPFSAVSELSGQTVTLSVASGAIGDQDWDMPSPLPTEGEAAGEGEPASIVTGAGDPAERGAWSPGADDYDLNPADTVTGRDTQPGLARPVGDAPAR